MWLITMVSFRPISRVVPRPNGLLVGYKWGLLTTHNSWNDSPSSLPSRPIPNVSSWTSLRRESVSSSQDIGWKTIYTWMSRCKLGSKVRISGL